MLLVSQAEELILSATPNPLAYPDPPSEILPLSAGLHRVLAQDLFAPRRFPHWDNAAMDGYALRWTDAAQAMAQQEGLELLPEAIPAGDAPNWQLPPASAARIFTGALLPSGADTVVMQEQVRVNSGKIYLDHLPTLGEYVRHGGTFAQASDRLLAAGTRLNPPELAGLAAMGINTVPVLPLVRVAIFTTGNELVNNELVNLDRTDLQTGQIFDSNQYALTALVQQTGALAINLGTVKDNPSALRQKISEALAVADVVISSGGVSVGDYDLVAQTLQTLGGQIHCQSVAIKPGKPLTMATFDNTDYRDLTDHHDLSSSPESPSSQVLPKVYLGVPGNPVSAIMSFWRFGRGIIAKRSGQLPHTWQPMFVDAVTTADLHSQGQRETYLWGNLETRLKAGNSKTYFVPVGDAASTVVYSSGNVISLMGCNGCAVLRRFQTYVPQGETVRVMVV
ncbi:MAG: molybdopterin molybdotransferase MoeA [Pseudanabaenaceae cyanobacterium]